MREQCRWSPLGTEAGPAGWEEPGTTAKNIELLLRASEIPPTTMTHVDKCFM